MLAVAPYSVTISSLVVNSGNSEGTTTEISIEVHPDAGPPFTMRTVLRTGVRMGPRGSVFGEATDTVSMAAMAVTGLFLQTFPMGLPRDEAHQLVHASLAEADTLAQEHNDWSYSPMLLEGVDYALRYRILDGGFVAHADIGDSVFAAWGTGNLPDSLRHAVRIDSDTVGTRPAARSA